MDWMEKAKADISDVRFRMRKSGTTLAVSLPMFYTDGDEVVVFVSEQTEGNYLLSDEGECLFHSTADATEFPAEVRKSAKVFEKIGIGTSTIMMSTASVENDILSFGAKLVAIGALLRLYKPKEEKTGKPSKETLKALKKEPSTSKLLKIVKKRKGFV